MVGQRCLRTRQGGYVRLKSEIGSRMAVGGGREPAPGNEARDVGRGACSEAEERLQQRGGGASEAENGACD